MTDQRIWLYWADGFEYAPRIGSICAASWINKNPSSSIIQLDNRNLRQYVSSSQVLNLVQGTTAPTLEAPFRSDILRLYLLSEYGGVWADVDVYCSHPLHDWLPERLISGFFAFSRPAPNRKLGNWFIAAHKSNRLIRGWLSIVLRYYEQFAQRPLARHSMRHPYVRLFDTYPDLWLNPLISRLIWGRPYYLAHYAFAHLIRTDAQAKAQWEQTPTLPARPALYGRWYGSVSDPNDRYTADLASHRPPAFKLDRRCDLDALPTTALVHRILAGEFDR